jgi:hypothetical protein
MRSQGRAIEVVGLTGSTDRAAIEKFRADTGASYPMLYGLSADTKNSYGVSGYPRLRVVDRGGRRVGDDLAAVQSALDG